MNSSINKLWVDAFQAGYVVPVDNARAESLKPKLIHIARCKAGDELSSLSLMTNG